MVLRERLYTAEEFWKYIDLPENDEKRLELEDGEIIDVGESRPVNTVTASRIGYFLNAFVIPHNLGYVTGADGGFKLGEKRVRIPDVGFISKARMPKLPKRFGVAPDLAVEVVSEDEDIHRKAREYLTAGTKIVWAVYPNERTVYTMRLEADGTLTSTPHGIDAELNGGAIIPGFKLPVRDIFPD